MGERILVEANWLRKILKKVGGASFGKTHEWSKPLRHSPSLSRPEERDRVLATLFAARVDRRPLLE